MRNLSRENLRTFQRKSGIPRTLTGEKRINLNESEVRVGKYKYDLGDQLGKGFSGKVFKGQQLGRSHKRVAIKVVEIKKFKANSLQMLENEIEIHRSLDHENIVKLLEVVKTPLYYYLVMEYCPHGSLSQYIAQKKTLSENHAIEIFNQLLEGYRYLLSEGILHRDIKPANILRVGNKWKISDFGFAARARFGFKDRMNVGTPLYMAPEILKRNYYSFKSDLYALGAVLYQMLTGVTPHEASSHEELLEKIVLEIQIPNSIKHPKIIEFLNRVFVISDAKRMQREQFDSFDFGSLDTIGHNSSCNSLMSSRRGSFCGDSLLKGFKGLSGTDNSVNKSRGSKVGSMCSDPSAGKDGSLQKDVRLNPMQVNQETLQTELNFVHHFYWLVQNQDSLCLGEEQKGMLVLSLFKLLLKILRLLCDKNCNYFELSDWKEYQQCKLYQQLYTELTHVSEKYQQEYLDFIKHNDIKVIRAVNRKFPELCTQNPLTSKFYRNFSNFVSSLLRQHDQQLAEILPQQEQISHHIQALQGLHAVYKVAFLRSEAPKQTLVGERPSKIKDYTLSTLSRNDYNQLKRQIRSL